MIKTILKSVREYKWGTFLTMILSISEVVFEILIPLTLSRLIDYGVYGGSMPSVLKFGVILLIEALLQLTIGMFSARLSAKTAAGFSANLREDMYRKVQTFSFSNIDKFSTSSIITRLTTDTARIQQAYQMSMRMAIRAPFMLIFGMIAAFKISHSISMVFLIALPILAITLLVVAKMAHPLFVKAFNTYDKLNQIVQENVRGIRVVKTFNQQDHEINKFSEVSEQIYHYFLRAIHTTALNNPMMQLCVYGINLVICWLGAHAIIASGNSPELGLTTGNLMALISYTMQILMSLMMLSMAMIMIILSMSSAKRIAEILNEESDIFSPEDPVYEVRDGDIQFRDVHFAYSSKADKEVLNDINLHFLSGQTIGILGPTGSSKTSLVQLIPRLYDVTDGQLLVGGVDVRNYDLVSLRDAVSMVLQKNELFAGTIKENLRWGNPDATDEQIIEACKMACADEFIEQKEDKYDFHIEQGGANVSGGQKQRLCIARALLKKPKILILDDSTSAVDTRTDARIQKAFREYIPDTTKIIIAQRIASIQSADQIVLMNDGRVEDCGSHDELMARSENYRSIYLSQTRKGDDQND
ncbi:MAG: ABC transporter ATP-binding protein [Erysipelotrichaceae bacterium]|nr:ABC transporter ATP-binding protein [Erysipelotrichaceae bacterium]